MPEDFQVGFTDCNDELICEEGNKEIKEIMRKIEWLLLLSNSWGNKDLECTEDFKFYKYYNLHIW